MASATGHARVVNGSRLRQLGWPEIVVIASGLVSALGVVPSLRWLYPVGVIVALSAGLAVALVALVRRGRSKPPRPPLGTEYEVTLDRSSGGQRTIDVFEVEHEKRSESKQVDWTGFGEGIEHLMRQIQNYNGRIAVDACIGVNDAGLVMAAFLSSAVFGSPHLGYVRYHRAHPGAELKIESQTVVPEPPELGHRPTLLLADFELKSGNALRGVVAHLRQTYEDPKIFLAAFGAQLDWPEKTRMQRIEELRARDAIADLDIELFVVCTMGDGQGIEPPLRVA